MMGRCALPSSFRNSQRATLDRLKVYKPVYACFAFTRFTYIHMMLHHPRSARHEPLPGALTELQTRCGGKPPAASTLQKQD